MESYGGRVEYDAQRAMHPDEPYEFTQTIDDMLYDGDSAIETRNMKYEADADGVLVTAEFSYDVGQLNDQLHGHTLDQVSIEIAYGATRVHRPPAPDETYDVSVRTLVRGDKMYDPLTTHYIVDRYSDTYVGEVRGYDATAESQWSSREMTPYDYAQLAAVALQARAAQRAEQRERASMLY